MPPGAGAARRAGLGGARGGRSRDRLPLLPWPPQAAGREAGAAGRLEGRSTSVHGLACTHLSLRRRERSRCARRLRHACATNGVQSPAFACLPGAGVTAHPASPLATCHAPRLGRWAAPARRRRPRRRPPRPAPTAGPAQRLHALLVVVVVVLLLLLLLLVRARVGAAPAPLRALAWLGPPLLSARRRAPLVLQRRGGAAAPAARSAAHPPHPPLLLRAPPPLLLPLLLLRVSPGPPPLRRRAHPAARWPAPLPLPLPRTPTRPRRPQSHQVAPARSPPRSRPRCCWWHSARHYPAPALSAASRGRLPAL